VGLRGELHLDGVAGGDGAAGEDDGHDASFADEIAFGAAVEDGLHEAGLDALELIAGIAEAGDLDDGFVADVEAGTGGECEQIDVAGGDVFADLAGGDVVAVGAEFVV
jgi:hypothetical protein